jgi:hypothetical protein
MFLCLHSDEFYLHLLHLLCPFDALWDWYCLLPLLEFMDGCVDPFFFHVPFMDLMILLQPGPKLRCFIKKSAPVLTCCSISCSCDVASSFL